MKTYTITNKKTGASITFSAPEDATPEQLTAAKKQAVADWAKRRSKTTTQTVDESATEMTREPETPKKPPYPVSRAEPQREPWKALGMGLLHGVTAGTSDELAGAGEAARGGDYATRRDVEREDYRRLSEANPGNVTLGEIVGSTVGLGALAAEKAAVGVGKLFPRLAKSLSTASQPVRGQLGRNVLRRAATTGKAGVRAGGRAAVEGAVYGAGTGEGGASEQVGNAIDNAILGALVGGTLGTGVQTVSETGKALARRGLQGPSNYDKSGIFRPTSLETPGHEPSYFTKKILRPAFGSQIHEQEKRYIAPRMARAAQMKRRYEADIEQAKKQVADATQAEETARKVREAERKTTQSTRNTLVDMQAKQTRQQALIDDVNRPFQQLAFDSSLPVNVDPDRFQIYATAQTPEAKYRALQDIMSQDMFKDFKAGTYPFAGKEWDEELAGIIKGATFDDTRSTVKNMVRQAFVGAKANMASQQLTGNQLLEIRNTLRTRANAINSGNPSGAERDLAGTLTDVTNWMDEQLEAMSPAFKADRGPWANFQQLNRVLDKNSVSQKGFNFTADDWNAEGLKSVRRRGETPLYSQAKQVQNSMRQIEDALPIEMAREKGVRATTQKRADVLTGAEERAASAQRVAEQTKRPRQVIDARTRGLERVKNLQKKYQQIHGYQPDLHSRALATAFLALPGAASLKLGMLTGAGGGYALSSEAMQNMLAGRGRLQDTINAMFDVGQNVDASKHLTDLLRRSAVYQGE